MFQIKIFQCHNGHPVCGECRPSLAQCPSCRTEIGDTGSISRNILAESIAAAAFHGECHDGECALPFDTKSAKKFEKILRKNEKRIQKENIKQEKRESKRLVKEERKLKKDIKRVEKEEDSDKILLAYVISNGQFF